MRPKIAHVLPPKKARKTPRLEPFVSTANSTCNGWP